jgi:hypothetical protein
VVIEAAPVVGDSQKLTRSSTNLQFAWMPEMAASF